MNVILPKVAPSDAETQALAAAVAVARAQREAGQSVPGEEVFRWLASWGTPDEVAPPEPRR